MASVFEETSVFDYGPTMKMFAVENPVLESEAALTNSTVVPMDSENKNGMVEVISFTDTIRFDYESDVIGVWPEIVSALDKHGLCGTLDPRGFQITISTTTRTKDPHIIDRARAFILLLCKTRVPPCLAMKVLNGEMFHEYIEMANQEGDKNGFREMLKKFEGYSEVISNVLGIRIFVNDESVVALADQISPLNLARTCLRMCFLENMNPRIVAAVLEKNVKLKRNSMTQFESGNADVDLKNEDSTYYVLESVESQNENVTSFTEKIREPFVKTVTEAWPVVESFLEKHGLCGTLDRAKCEITMTTTRTKDPDFVIRARNFLQCLCKIGVPLDTAMRTLNGELQYVYIKFGYQKCGLAKKENIEKKRFLRNARRLHKHIKEIGDLLKCDIYTCGDHLFAAWKTGNRSLRRYIITKIVWLCIVKDLKPPTMINRIVMGRKHFKLVTKRLQDLISELC